MPDPTSDTLDRIHDRIAKAAPSGVWSRADFLDIGTPYAVEKALQRLTRRGDIRRPCRGFYDKPSISKLTGKMVFPPRASFIDAIARRDKLRVLVDGMTAANDLGLTTAVPARSTIYADTYPRTIEIEASVGDPKATKPVIYKLDFKRISAKTAFWAGRPAMRVIQALTWFRDERSSLDAAVNGIMRHLSRDPKRQIVAQDLRDNIHAVPAWMYPLIETIAAKLLTESETDIRRAKEEHATDVH
ncbi:DUF6088 family protein [Mesorhizobium sp. M0659]|uniref:DUF6088 family protein n=1 Tax=Mesorhizobium sp. M0659 TaxID=2956980 RepID=UPI003338070E